MSRAELAQLHDLQQIDLEIERATAETEALQRALAADSTSSARATDARSARAARAAGEKVRAGEETVAETRERLARQEQRLYAGHVGAKDLAKAQAEIEHLRTLAAAQEDALLALMLEAEEAQATAQMRREELARAIEAREHEHADASAKLEQASARLERLRGERDTQARQCAPALLDTYEQVRRAHAGRAVAEVHGGVCSGCRVTLTPATLQRARTSTSLPLCDNCGRILHMM
ncbi:MAG TPA: C4-type zinc ribbon domain-containing protein [Ktedonobacterales bacterium]